MRCTVINCFTDKTLLGKYGAFRDVGTVFEADEERAAELEGMGLVKVERPKKKAAKKAAKKTKE